MPGSPDLAALNRVSKPRITEFRARIGEFSTRDEPLPPAQPAPVPSPANLPSAIEAAPSASGSVRQAPRLPPVRGQAARRPPAGLPKWISPAGYLYQDFPTSSTFGNTGKGVADPVATILMLLDWLADQQTDERCGRLDPRGDRFRPRLRAEDAGPRRGNGRGYAGDPECADGQRSRGLRRQAWQKLRSSAAARWARSTPRSWRTPAMRSTPLRSGPITPRR